MVANIEVTGIIVTPVEAVATMRRRGVSEAPGVRRGSTA
jgi:hypothetical protein